MDELPSTEFRKRFARLTESTAVTVNGHVIGYWRPADTRLGPYPNALRTPPHLYWDRRAQGMNHEEATAAERLTVAESKRPPFTPAPKTKR